MTQVIREYDGREQCEELLYGSDGFVAVCTQPFGTEHDHSDKTVEQAVESGLARVALRCPVCGGPTECNDPNCIEGCRECIAKGVG
jgi:hypothetical protein